MPLEDAEYISALQSDWPTPRDKRSEGDDQLRLIKKVLQNTFPSADAPITGTPDELNNLTSGLIFVPADEDAGTPAAWKLTDPADSETLRPLNLAQQKGEDAAVTLGMMYPVGVVVISAKADFDPAEYYGFGTWEKRAGTLLGEGTVVDGDGNSQAFSAGQSVGMLRVHREHIVPFGVDLSITGQTAGAGGHEHQGGMGAPGVAWDSDYVVGSDNDSHRTLGYTSRVEDHVHTFDAAATGDIGGGEWNFIPAGWVFYVWERTA